MKKLKPLVTNQTALSTFLSILILVVFRHASAQTTSLELTRQKLTAKIHLDSDTITVQKAAQSLSEQTGLHIDAVNYLQMRHLTVQMKDITAEQALSAICELNGWICIETEEGHLLITKPRSHVPEQIKEVPKAIQTSLPKDFQRYIGVGIKLDDLPPPTDEKAIAYEQVQQKTPAGQTTLINDRVVSRLKSKSDQLASLLFASLTIQEGTRIEYTKLTKDQQRYLLGILVLRAFLDVNQGMSGILMRGQLAPYHFDPSVSRIRVRDGNMLMIGAGWKDKGVGYYTEFGMQLSPGPSSP